MLKKNQKVGQGMTLGTQFGTVDFTPGQNVAIAVLAREVGIGIPEKDYDKVIDIFKLVFTPEECDYMCRGFGLNGNNKQFLKEFATDFDIPGNNASKMTERLIEKLRKSPFKTQIKNLCMSVDEVNAYMSKLRHDDDKRLEVEVLQKRYENAIENARNADAAREEAEAKIRQLEYDNDRLAAQVNDLNSALDAVRKQNAELTVKAEKAEKVTEALKEATKILEKTASSLEAQEAEDGGLKSLGLKPETISALSKTGIKTLDQLVSKDSHTLSRLGLGRFVKDIQVKLKKKGLALRSVA